MTHKYLKPRSYHDTKNKLLGLLFCHHNPVDTTTEWCKFTVVAFLGHCLSLRARDLLDIQQ